MSFKAYHAAWICVLGPLMASISCSEAKFSGSNGSVPQESEPAADAPAPTPSPVAMASTDTCIEGDKANFEFSNQEIQKCIDQGQLWNFDLNVCTKMPKSSFDCSFDEFFQQMEKRGMSPSSLLKQGKEKSALIIGCGESQDGKTILLQWFFRPDGYKAECKVDKAPGNIITGCYGGDGRDPNGLSDEERKKVVLECMNKNATD